MQSGYVEVASGASPRRVELEGDLLTVGAAATNAVTLADDATVSKLHAVLERTGTGWLVRDAGSSSGTYVNGQRLTGEHPLGDGDEILVGSTRLTVHAPAAQPHAYLDLTEEWHAGETTDAAPSPPVGRTAVPARPPQKSAPPVRARPQVLAAPSDRRRGAVHVGGTARNVRMPREGSQGVLSFRLDRYDGSGNRIDPVAVEFRGYRRGQIHDGEDVDVRGKWSRGTVRAKKVRNLSTGSEVLGPGAVAKAFGVVFVTLFMIVWLSIAGFIAFEIIRQH